MRTRRSRSIRNGISIVSLTLVGATGVAHASFSGTMERRICGGGAVRGDGASCPTLDSHCCFLLHDFDFGENAFYYAMPVDRGAGYSAQLAAEVQVVGDDGNPSNADGANNVFIDVATYNAAGVAFAGGFAETTGALISSQLLLTDDITLPTDGVADTVVVFEAGSQLSGVQTVRWEYNFQAIGGLSTPYEGDISRYFCARASEAPKSFSNDDVDFGATSDPCSLFRPAGGGDATWQFRDLPTEHSQGLNDASVHAYFRAQSSASNGDLMVQVWAVAPNNFITDLSTDTLVNYPCRPPLFGGCGANARKLSAPAIDFEVGDSIVVNAKVDCTVANCNQQTQFQGIDVTWEVNGT